jgi:hypothetical protein
MKAIYALGNLIICIVCLWVFITLLTTPSFDSGPPWHGKTFDEQYKGKIDPKTGYWDITKYDNK